MKNSTKIKIGAKVEHEEFGEGIVENISKNLKAKLPVKVYFKERNTYSFFTMDGKSHANAIHSKMIRW